MAARRPGRTLRNIEQLESRLALTVYSVVEPPEPYDPFGIPTNDPSVFISNGTVDFSGDVGSYKPGTHSRWHWDTGDGIQTHIDVNSKIRVDVSDLQGRAFALVHSFGHEILGGSGYEVPQILPDGTGNIYNEVVITRGGYVVLKPQPQAGPWESFFADIIVIDKTYPETFRSGLPYSVSLTIGEFDALPPRVPTLQINGVGPNDNITLFNAAHDQQPAVSQNATLTVGNISSPVTISLSPSSPRVITFEADGATPGTEGSIILDPSKGLIQTVTITPTGNSTSADDVVINAEAVKGEKSQPEKMTVVKVTIPKQIRHLGYDPTLPAMIPPRITNVFSITISPDLVGVQKSVSLKILNQDIAGTVLVNGFKEYHGIQSSQELHFQTPPSSPASRDPSQTPLDKQGQLQLALLVAGEEMMKSEGFSVQAVPINFRIRNPIPLRKVAWYVYKYGGTAWFGYQYDSSSGNLLDLEGIEIREQIRFSTGRLPWPFLGTVVNYEKDMAHGPDGKFDDSNGLNFKRIRRPYRRASYSILQKFEWYFEKDPSHQSSTLAIYNMEKGISPARGRWQYYLIKHGERIAWNLPR